ncbi:MAG: hypothetical protein KAT79_01785 [candidate division Zixibacteria bacterium]|nr:hypothetical protein [candidate division Zixibacteria bacterium]
MKKMSQQFLSLAAAAILAIILACGGDDSGTKSDNLNDSDFAAFMNEYTEIDKFTVDMLSSMFGFMGTIVDSATPDPSSRDYFTGTATDEIAIVYHEPSQFWYCSTSYSNSGVLFQVVDSIQFRHGDEIVQWPDSLLVTEIASFLRVTASGGDIHQASAFQNLTLSRPTAETDTVTINGTGNVTGDVSWTTATGTDSTSCHATYDLDYTISDLKFDLLEELDGEADEIRSASEGVVDMTGSLNLSCAGTGGITLGGAWNVLQTYDDGLITYVITNGIFTWNFTQPCP